MEKYSEWAKCRAASKEAQCEEVKTKMNGMKGAHNTAKKRYSECSATMQETPRHCEGTQ